MNIGFDYDDTYTRDPIFWIDFIKNAQKRGHYVFLTTWRTPSECEDLDVELVSIVDGVYPTSRKAKSSYMYQQGIRIDIWIDDNPSAVIYDMQPY